jgi:hypothetical protein
MAEFLTEAETIINARFVRRPMSDFEYLKASIKPKPWQLGLAMLINALIAAGLAFYCYSNDVRSFR